MKIEHVTIAALVAHTFFLMSRGDSMESFYLGGFLGLVVGGALGVAFAYGEHERRHGGDPR